MDIHFKFKETDECTFRAGRCIEVIARFKLNDEQKELKHHHWIRDEDEYQLGYIPEVLQQEIKQSFTRNILKTYGQKSNK